MAARRCSLCSINYPSIAQFQRCPIHDEPTMPLHNQEPDPNWKDQFEGLKRRAEAADEIARPIPRVRDVEVIEDCGQLFVEQNALTHAGLRLSRMMNVQFYLFELDDGWIYETQGFDEPRRRWWVERVIEVEAPDLAAELGLTESEEASAA